MSQDLIEKKREAAEAIAKRFDDMATRIRLNGTDNFGGAFLLVPPAGVGSPVELLTLATTNPGHFWLMVKSHVEEEWRAAQDMANRQRTFG